mgnify:CR=1 FL=1|jgi:hypothetical protein
MSANYTTALNMINQHDFTWMMSNNYFTARNRAEQSMRAFVAFLSNCTPSEAQELKGKWMNAYKATSEAISNSFK